jgi:hypothetical protein
MIRNSKVSSHKSNWLLIEIVASEFFHRRAAEVAERTQSQSTAWCLVFPSPGTTQMFLKTTRLPWVWILAARAFRIGSYHGFRIPEHRLRQAGECKQGSC